MVKIDLQFFGGRGAGSSSGGGSGGVFSTGRGGGSGKSLGLAGQTYFEDGNKVSVSGTLNFWEGKSAGLKKEELLMVDEDGFACGYFKGGATSVSFSIPKDVDPKKTVLTHNHPAGGKDGRTIGGSFSNADLNNHIDIGFKETRATSVEGTYSFKTGRNANATGFKAALKTRQSECLTKAKNKVAKGDTRSEIDIYLDECHKWYKTNCKKYGYEYSFTKAKGSKK